MNKASKSAAKIMVTVGKKLIHVRIKQISIQTYADLVQTVTEKDFFLC